MENTNNIETATLNRKLQLKDNTISYLLERIDNYKDTVKRLNKENTYLSSFYEKKAYEYQKQINNLIKENEELKEKYELCRKTNN